MKKAVFKNQYFYFVVIMFLVLLLIWNSYVVFLGSYVGLIPILIQLVLLFLILTKNPYSKIGLKFFSVIFLIGASGLQVVSALLKASIGEFETVNGNKLLFSLLNLAIGIIILVYTNKTVIVSERE